MSACNWGRNIKIGYVRSVGASVGSVGAYSNVVGLGVKQRANIQSVIPSS